MPLVYSWFFWVFIIGIIAIIVGGILIFATDLGWIAWFVAGIGLLFVIIGVIFWIMDARKPKKKLSNWEKFKQRTPGVYEFTQFEEKTGLGDSRRRVQQYGIDATKAAGRNVASVYGGAKDVLTSEPWKRQIRLGLVTNVASPIPPVFLAGSAVATYNYTMSRRRQQALNRLKALNPELAEQIRKNERFNRGNINQLANQYIRNPQAIMSNSQQQQQQQQQQLVPYIPQNQ